MKKPRTKRSQIILEWVIRWWGAGAVFFFIAWGTGLGLQDTVIDMIFVLGLGIGLFTIVVLDPVIYGFLEIERDGEVVAKAYYQRTIFQNVYLRLGEIVKAVTIVAIVTVIYGYINVILINIRNLSETQVPFQAEPIMFGVFYILIFMLFRLIYRMAKKLIKKKV